MKLIIELEDDIAKGIRGENECEVEPREIVRSFQATIADAIANGTPYNPTGDCISRSDLRKEVVGMMINKADDLEEVEFEINSALASVCEKIINAPTVPIPNEQVAWEQGFEAGLAQGKHDRTKAEWIRVEPTEEDIEKNLVPQERIECSNCHLPNRHIQYDEYHDEMTVTYHNTHYCPNCGAKMSISKGKDV